MRKGSQKLLLSFTTKKMYNFYGGRMKIKKILGTVAVVLLLTMFLFVGSVLAAPIGQTIDIAEINFGDIMMLAILGESIVETIKWTYEPTDKPTRIKRIIALGVGVLLAVLVNIDLFTMIGFKLAVPYVGAVLTGVLMARGSNVFHADY